MELAELIWNVLYLCDEIKSMLKAVKVLSVVLSRYRPTFFSRYSVSLELRPVSAS